MKKLILLLSIVLLASCSDDNRNGKTLNTDNANQMFDQFKDAFIEDLWELYPGWASYMGYHKYDSVLVVPSDEYRQRELSFCSKFLDTLKTFDLLQLSPNNKIDHHLIREALVSIQWYVNEYRSYEWKPSYYNVAGGFEEILNNKYYELEDGLRIIYKRMANVPAYYANAKSNIKNPTIEHTDLAIRQNTGALSVFENMLTDSINKAKIGEHERQMIMARVDKTIETIKEYVSWLEDEIRPGLTPETAKDFRLGKELYDVKFVHDIQSGFTAEEIYNNALQQKKEIHQKMIGMSKDLWGKYMAKEPMPDDGLKVVRTIISKISLSHAHRDSLLDAIKAQIPELVDFVNKKQLMYMDPEKPLVVRETPLYMRGTGAGASVSSPGPYDKEANTYYNVTPLDDYTDEQAESYLREYNYYTLQILNIHEAIPGHYTQLIYSNQSPSIIKSIFGNGAMVEGWAVYTERMMLEEGYGNDEPELWLMYYKWFLRVACNTILDYSVHVLGMTEEEAMKLLMEEAFQEETEAGGKWRRVKLTQVQLCSYFAGFSEIYALREEVKQKSGDSFNLKEFHEKFLSYGSAPVKYIRELMND